MKRFEKIIKEVTIYCNVNEKDKVCNKLFVEDYRIIRAGPVVKKFRAVKNSYKVVAIKEIKKEIGNVSI